MAAVSHFGGTGEDPCWSFIPVARGSRPVRSSSTFAASRITSHSSSSILVAWEDRPTDKRAYSFGDYADDLEQLRIILDVERFSLFGTSRGGAVSIAYSVAYPNRVDRLILCATRAGRFDTDEGERVKAIKIRSGEPWFPSAMQPYQRLSTNQWETEEDLSQLVIRSMPLAFGHFGRPQAATLEAGREAFSHPNGDLHREEEIPEPRDRLSDLEHIRAPTLVFQGTEDPLVPKRHGEEIARRVRGARLVLLEGVGHSFPWVDGRDRMREEIVAFLSRT